MRHDERHRVGRLGWLRAAVLGANDGVTSTASLIIGVTTASASRGSVLAAGASGLVAGAMSMAAGEYVSVSSQADAESADLARERAELDDQPDAELAELAELYRARGLDPELARRVAEQLTGYDALDAHARDELGLGASGRARPVQAAAASALSFAVGAAVPLVAAIAFPSVQAVAVVVVTLLALAALGAIGARLGGAKVARGSARVVLWGALAMAVTAAIGIVVSRVWSP